jgi:endonuclease YncB( thermonuclease family)
MVSIPVILLVGIGASIVGIRTPQLSNAVTLGPAFTVCHTGGAVNYVVDGDTEWINGLEVHVADIDAPEPRQRQRHVCEASGFGRSRHKNACSA